MYVKTLQLENIRGFSSINFDLERPGGAYSGWTVFVGGNASGKSTLLKSIALALMGPEKGAQLLGTPVGWIKEGEKRGEILLKVHWDESDDSFGKRGKLPRGAFNVGVRFVADSKDSIVPALRAVDERSPRGTRIQTAERGPWNPNAKGWFSAGYGPMRRLSGSSSESIRFAVGGGAVSRFVTLFREDAALSESETWLKTNYSRLLEAERDHRTSSEALRILLNGVQGLLNDSLLPHGMTISRITVDHVFIVDKRGLELPMRDISDGCRSIYATVLDLVHAMAEVYGLDGLFGKDVSDRIVVTRPGVVPIDEIEAHLHPAWQREIPEWLKVHFPNVQFLVTTHSPLVAQAADPNGAFVLPSQIDLDREPRPLDGVELEKLRLGQALKTLLGSAFGLVTTRSKWADQQIKRWQLLNAKNKSGVGLTGTEIKEKKILDAQMTFAFDQDAEAH